MTIEATKPDTPHGQNDSDPATAAATTTPKRSVRRRRTEKGTTRNPALRLVPHVALFGLIIGAWYFVAYVILDPQRRFLVSAPHLVAKEGFGNSDTLSILLHALWNTTSVALTGLALAIVLGVGAAVAMSQAKWLERSLYPYAVVLQCVPILAIVPLIGFWFGYGFSSRVVVCYLVAFFPIIANTLLGLRSVDESHLDLFRLHHAGRFTVLRKLMIPSAAPYIFGGIRISAGLSIVGAIVGDFFFKQGEPGIGVLIDQYRARLQSEEMFAAIILASVLGVLAFWLIDVVTKMAIGRWHSSV
jgi:NitT/TauT family transport system permease protein